MYLCMSVFSSFFRDFLLYLVRVSFFIYFVRPFVMSLFISFFLYACSYLCVSCFI